jgi:peptidyl-prolyl cis-trans isomerase D
MFDYIRKNPRLAQAFLALITLPFLFTGVESYVRDMSSGAELASVGKTKISSQEYQTALREQSERMSQQMGGKFDPKMLTTPEARKSILESLVNQRLLALAVKDGELGVSDAELARFIATVPSLQEGGKFSPERYAALVAGQGMSKEIFESRLRQDMAQQQLVQPIGDAAISSKQVAERWARLQLEQRNIAEFRFSPEQFMRSVKLEADAAEKYYESNRKQFETAEQVRVEYVMLDQNELQAQITVSDADIEVRYKAQPDRFSQPESRRASHILLKLAKDATEAEIAAAQTKLSGIQTQLAKDPKAFADLARKFSDDPGSAQKGGDLDWFGRGMMVKPFEDAAFSLKEGETSAAVRSDFGFHLIRVTGVKTAKVKPLADVKADITVEMKRELASRKFAEAVEGFGNTVYEQPDSLKPAAEQWKLALRSSDWLRKGQPMPAPFDHTKLGAAIFSEEVTLRKHNTEAIEVASGKLVAARVMEHRPAAVQPLDAVRNAIVARLTTDQAATLATAEGAAKLASLQKGEASELKFGLAHAVLRASPAGLPPTVARQIFAADTSKVPAYVGGVATDGAYTIYKISGVMPAAADDPRLPMVAQQYQRVVAETEFAGWLANLRQRYTVKVNEKALGEVGERQ